MYEGVPSATACSIIFAESIGGVFNKEIKADRKFGYRKITREESEAV